MTYIRRRCDACRRLEAWQLCCSLGSACNVDANRLTYWLGKLVVMAPRKLALCKHFPYSCFLYTSFCAVLSISEVNSRHSIHPLTTNDACFSTFNFQHQRLANGYSLQRDLCSLKTLRLRFYYLNSVQE